MYLYIEIKNFGNGEKVSISTFKRQATYRVCITDSSMLVKLPIALLHNKCTTTIKVSQLETRSESPESRGAAAAGTWYWLSSHKPRQKTGAHWRCNQSPAAQRVHFIALDAVLFFCDLQTKVIKAHKKKLECTCTIVRTHLHYLLCRYVEDR